MPNSPVQFSAVLLAGGKSSRMGRDKAALVVNGRPLWRRQLATLEATGAAEVFVSGKPDWPHEGIVCVPDSVEDSGPLAGIAASLRHCASPFLLALAVDMPSMTAAFLQKLAALAAEPRTGVVPVLGGRFEPLAAIYPKGALPIAEGRLRLGIRKLENFVAELEHSGLVTRHIVAEADAALFANWNEPGDVQPQP